MLVGGGAGVLRDQGRRVPAGEERVLGVERSSAPTRGFVPLFSFAFLFLPPLWMDIGIRRT